MGKTNANITKEKILKAAEHCFSNSGFDGTGIEKISEEAGVNKALIYYHFKSKEGLLHALYKLIMEEVKILVDNSIMRSSQPDKKQISESFRTLLSFLKEKRDLMKILLMEALKGGESSRIFIQLAEYIMQDELQKFTDEDHGQFKDNPSFFLVYEFFTGFMPMYSYAIFCEIWPEYFNIDEETVEKYFIDSFIETHMSHHYK